MATEKQIAANKRNAARSTGPRTTEGKARSRLNARSHGLSYLGTQLGQTVANESTTVEFHNDLERIRVERTERMTKLHDMLVSADPKAISRQMKEISSLSRYESRVHIAYRRIIHS